jgi:uncharacterized membrane protein YdjX (TVP38/TMEM64 family)
VLEQWVEENIFGVLLAIEIMWVGGFLAIFVAYFAVKWHFRKARKEKALAEKAAAEKARREP